MFFKKNYAYAKQAKDTQVTAYSVSALRNSKVYNEHYTLHSYVYIYKQYAVCTQSNRKCTQQK